MQASLLCGSDELDVVLNPHETWLVDAVISCGLFRYMESLHKSNFENIIRTPQSVNDVYYMWVSDGGQGVSR